MGPKLGACLACHSAPFKPALALHREARLGTRAFSPACIRACKWVDEVVENAVLPELSKGRYESRLWSQIEKAECLSHPDELGDKDGVVVYRDNAEYRRLAEHLGIISKCHESGPRAAFKGVVILRVRDVQLFLVPRTTWSELSSDL